MHALHVVVREHRRELSMRLDEVMIQGRSNSVRYHNTMLLCAHHDVKSCGPYIVDTVIFEH